MMVSFQGQKEAAAMEREGRGSQSCDGGHWSSLPHDLLLSIMMKLNPVDYSSFRRACRGWRLTAKDAEKLYVSSLPPLLVPLLPHPRNALYSCKHGAFIYVQQSQPEEGTQKRERRLHPKDIVLGFSHGYLIFRDKDDEARLMLAHPLTGVVVDGISIPPAPTHLVFSRVCMTSSPTSPDCLLVALSHARVLYCRPGDERWQLHELDREADGRIPRVGIHGMAAIGHKVYIMTLDKSDLLQLELLPSPRVTKLEAVGLPPFPKLSPFLVDCGEDLLVVNGQGRRCAVYRLDREARRWVEVHDLRGRAIALNTAAATLSWQPTVGSDDADCIYSYHLSRWYVFRLTDGWQQSNYVPRGCQHGCRWVPPSLCVPNCSQKSLI